MSLWQCSQNVVFIKLWASLTFVGALLFLICSGTLQIPLVNNVFEEALIAALVAVYLFLLKQMAGHLFNSAEDTPATIALAATTTQAASTTTAQTASTTVLPQSSGSLNSADLVNCYVPTYVRYLDRMRSALNAKRITFTGFLDNRNGSPVQVLEISTRLKDSAVDKILIKLCEKGRFHKDVCIALKVKVDIPNQAVPLMKRRLGFEPHARLPQSIKCSVGFKGFGTVGTYILKVEIDSSDLLDARYSGKYQDVAALFQPDVDDECCICLDLVCPEQTRYMQCGHYVHSHCYKQLMDHSQKLCCPLCRASLPR